MSLYSECVVDVKSNFVGIFFQDTIIKDEFCSYPEIMFLDATYKWLRYILSSSIQLLRIDGWRFYRVVNESKETIEWLIDSFKRNNNIQGLRVVMADKHITERNVIKGRLNAPVLFTYFML